MRKRKFRFSSEYSSMGKPIDQLGKQEKYVLKKFCLYQKRLFQSFSLQRLGSESLEILLHAVEDFFDPLLLEFINSLPSEKQRSFRKKISRKDYNEKIEDLIVAILNSSHAIQDAIQKNIITLLEKTINNLRYRGKCDLERKLEIFQRMFACSDDELELLTMLYMIEINRKMNCYFEDYLKCNKPEGREYLQAILAVDTRGLNKLLTGRLNDLGVLDMEGYDGQIGIDHEFSCFFAFLKTEDYFQQYCQKVSGRNSIPLHYHFIPAATNDFIFRLLQTKPEKSSTNILLYGPPGTGKTSYAQGLAKKLAIPSYEVHCSDSSNSSLSRRLAIYSTLNLTNHGDGSILIIDEADNLLNTQMAWLHRGETQDKGWLNMLLDEVGNRIIWISSEIEDIEPSVLRRFAVSIHFKQLNRRQRVQLWRFVLKRHKVVKMLSPAEIEMFAQRYNVSAGVIDLAIRKIKEIKPESAADFAQMLEISLKAHQILMLQGQEKEHKDIIEENYSLSGLNTTGDISGMLSRLQAFDGYLRAHDKVQKVMNYNLLFYGPPGSGKSELARYIAVQLKREILVKRASDILNAYVGMTEQHIKETFQEAEREEAVLIIDEADSLIFNRDRAQRSWEISFTNEFLAQMERFRGILICTTNRFNDIDDASVRRFNYKVGFGYLQPEGVEEFYRRLLAPLLDKPIDEIALHRLQGVTNLTPGDYKTVRDLFVFADPAELSHVELVGALIAESEIKSKKTKPVRIGFAV